MDWFDIADVILELLLFKLLHKIYTYHKGRGISTN